MKRARAGTSSQLAFISALMLVGVAVPTALSQPIIVAFAPTVGSSGDQITLYGQGFSLPGVTVRFWSQKPATINFISSDTQMTVTVPTGVATGPLSIQQGGGIVTYSPEDFIAIGSGPYILEVRPLYARTNDLVEIAGVHFAGVGKNGVSFNGCRSTDAAVNADGTYISVHVPYGASSGWILVTTPRGTGTNPEPFTVLGPGPYVSSFLPQIGTPGTVITLNGLNFTGVTNVAFSGTRGLNLAVQSDTLIRVEAPPDVRSGPLTVQSRLGNFTTMENFFAPPKILSFSPGAGRAGTNTVIRGINFLGATLVSFGNQSASSFTVQNNTNISAQVPAGAVTGLIRVSAPAGSAFSTSNFVTQPTIFSFSPIAGPAGTPVRLTGANFNVGTPIIKFNGITAAAPTSVSFDQLTVVVPAGATTGRISITTSDGSHTNIDNFYLPASITRFAPNNSAPGSKIAMAGQNFTGATAVTFNGVSAPGFTVTNNTSLGVTVPDGVTTGPISITTPAGTASSSALFYGPPRITSFLPTHGLPGTNVIINGLNFLGTTSVRFSTASATFSVVNNSQLKATVPPGALSGLITVVAPAGTNTSSSSFVLDYLSDLTVSASSAPNPVTIGSNLLYTLKVVNKGPLSAPHVMLTFSLPPSLLIRSTTAPNSWVISTNSGGMQAQTLSLPVNAPAMLSVTAIPRTAGTLSSTATVSCDYSDPVATNNTTQATTVVEPLALLSIHLLAETLYVSWPSLLTNHVLEFKGGLEQNEFWVRVPITPVVSGQMKFITVTNLGPASYYRLRK